MHTLMLLQVQYMDCVLKNLHEVVANDDVTWKFLGHPAQFIMHHMPPWCSAVAMQK